MLQRQGGTVGRTQVRTAGRICSTSRVNGNGEIVRYNSTRERSPVVNVQVIAFLRSVHLSLWVFIRQASVVAQSKCVLSWDSFAVLLHRFALDLSLHVNSDLFGRCFVRQRLQRERARLQCSLQFSGVRGREDRYTEKRSRDYFSSECTITRVCFTQLH